MHQQKLFYDRKSAASKYVVGEPVWLSVPTAGKLDPRWEGGWNIYAVKSSTNVEIQKCNRFKIVHINRIRHRIQPDIPSDNHSTSISQPWSPTVVEHVQIPQADPTFPPVLSTDTVPPVDSPP